MSRFKKNKNQLWHSPVVLFFMLVVFSLISYSVIGLFEKERETNQKKTLVLDQLNELNKRKENLNNDINKLETEEGIEDLIRQKYQVVKEGEKMVTIVDEDRQKTSMGEENSKHGFIEWIKNMFE